MGEPAFYQLPGVELVYSSARSDFIMTFRLISALLLLTAFESIATAARMDFQTAVQGAFLTAPFEENGVRLAVISGHYDLWDSGGNIAAGLDSVHTGPSTVRISLVSGSLFNLDSIGILAADPSSFMSSSTGAVYHFVPGGPISGFQRIAYFDILSSVDIAQGFLFDNIELTAVPEPSALPLLAMAMLTMQIPRRRQSATMRIDA